MMNLLRRDMLVGNRDPTLTPLDLDYVLHVMIDAVQALECLFLLLFVDEPTLVGEVLIREGAV